MKIFVRNFTHIADYSDMSLMICWLSKRLMRK